MFNATERAIRRLRRAQLGGEGLAYALALEEELSSIINDERNW